MWSLILYFLFGIGQTTMPHSGSEVAPLQNTDAFQAGGGDTGGETSTPRPPIPPKGNR
ncbi:hypothetical protein ACR78Z_10735 [Sphingobacterium thalpophilum]|uniref:hypothetical protein n=1 Tax=Sphingobacterium thalpophilum TaxID=259 RepID=UPI003DA1CDCA